MTVRRTPHVNLGDAQVAAAQTSWRGIPLNKVHEEMLPVELHVILGTGPPAHQWAMVMMSTTQGTHLCLGKRAACVLPPQKINS